MSFSPTRSRTLLVGACCAAAGIGAGAVTSATASSHKPATHHAHGTHHMRGHGLRDVARRSVQGDAVVRTKSGYETVTWARGIITAVSGDQITLAEGKAGDPYKTVTLTVPADAHVRDNRQKATLSAVTVGERALVAQLPKRTVVIAHTAKASTR